MKKGRNSFVFSNVYLANSAVVTGPKEALGPLKNDFDYSFDDLHCGEKTWEKAEEKLMKEAISILLRKTHLKEQDIDLIISGDLINQNVISNYVMRDYDIAYSGIYGACSTSILGIINAAFALESNNAQKVISCVSSHYCDAERQYRNPTEYGGAKPNTQTSTVTGASACLLTNEINKIKITCATMGRVIDGKEKNPNDMGSAMAPAAAITIKRHFEDLGRDPSYYDLILTGDLSSVGKPILLDILKTFNYELNNYNDAGTMIYDLENQDVFAGGSGCACLGVVGFSTIKKMLLSGILKKVLLIGTGALLNPLILNQKETIPSIAHAVCLEVM